MNLNDSILYFRVLANKLLFLINYIIFAKFNVQHVITDVKNSLPHKADCLAEFHVVITAKCFRAAQSLCLIHSCLTLQGVLVYLREEVHNK